jgi:SAM-dependent MidA family methyltransferase
MHCDDTGLARRGVPVSADPLLSESEQAHLRRAQARLAQEIGASGGWISFERYMDIVLYAPGLGYYSAGAQKLGEGGDFTTAPEISSLFAACLARQCAAALANLGEASILEIGAGSGRLAAELLPRLAELGCAPHRYLILEVSADLRERQRRTIAARAPSWLDRIEWLDSPLIAPFAGVVLANEVLDALPVARFRWFSTHCEELGVALESDRLTWAPRAAGATLARACERLAAAGGGWEEGYVSEYCSRLAAWSAHVTSAHRAGLALWIDYGLPRREYYLPERRDGTLIGHFRQRVNDDPFLYPTLQDLSAWVDFTLLAEACAPAGYELAGFTTQAHFLAGLGLDEEMSRIAAGDAMRFARLAAEARRLVLPGEMGERFKVMAWLKGAEIALPGFALNDLRHTL